MPAYCRRVSVCTVGQRKLRSILGPFTTTVLCGAEYRGTRPISHSRGSLADSDGTGISERVPMLLNPNPSASPRTRPLPEGGSLIAVSPCLPAEERIGADSIQLPAGADFAIALLSWGHKPSSRSVVIKAVYVPSPKVLIRR